MSAGEFGERGMTGRETMEKTLDLISIGRSLVDLYGQQIANLGFFR